MKHKYYIKGFDKKRIKAERMKPLPMSIMAKDKKEPCKQNSNSINPLKKP